MEANPAYEERPWLNCYAPGVPSEVAVPLKSAGEAFDEATDKWNNKPAIVFHGKSISYRELREKVDRLAAALANLGVKKGDRVVTLLLNCPEFVFAFYAAVKLGAVAVPLSPIHVASELKQQLQDSGTQTIICQDILYGEVAKTGIKLQNVILTNITESLPAAKRPESEDVLREAYQKMEMPPAHVFRQRGFYRLQTLFKQCLPDPPKTSVKQKEDLVSICYTGGTTGMPKGVMISHYAFMACVTQFHPWFPFEDGKDVQVVYAPMYHIGGQAVVMGHLLLSGGTMVLITNPKVDHILDAIVKYGATYFTGLPTMYESLKDYEGTSKVDWNKIKFCTTAMDTLHNTTSRDWRSRTGHSLYQIYGLTEAPGCILSPFGRAKNGSIGVPVPNVVAAIADPEQHRFVPVGEEGELVVYGPNVTLGYWHNPEATERTRALIDGKQWFRTGDLARMDKDGYFYLSSRIRDLIKYKGLRIHSAEVEEVLKTHPHIKEAVVIGVPDVKVGELVKAFVVVDKDLQRELSKEEIIDYCHTKLAHYKVPRMVEFIQEIPKTRVGKISRKALREM